MGSESKGKTLGQRVRERREALGLSQDDLAKAIDIEQPSVLALEKSAAKRSKHILALAKALKVNAEWLETGEGEMLPPTRSRGSVTQSSKREVPWIKNIVNVKVVGAVQAGVWGRAFEWSDDDQYETPVRINPKFNGLAVVGLEVLGPSMNKVYPSGTVVVCVSFIELGRDPIEGDRVVVQHWRGEQVEATVKEFRRDAEGVPQLWPLSNHADHQKPLKLAKPPKGEQILVTHKVIQAIIDES